MSSSRPGGALEPGEKRPQAPHSSQVVHVDDLLDELGLDLEKAPTRGHPRVVHEQPDRRMPLEDPRRDLVHLLAVGHVAELPLAADLARDLPETILATSEQHAVPTSACELPRRRLPDPGRGAGDHRYAPSGHRRASLSV